jgi:mono/diheme cytochrome c family protein
MHWKWFFAGAIALPVVACVLGAVYLKTHADGFSARAEPAWIESTMAMEARKLAIPPAAKSLANPIADSPEVMAEARAHWADHCAGCHSNDGSGKMPMGKQMYPPAPDMREQRTQQMTDGELFYVIENGVRLTGMPAWGGPGHGSEDSWKLVRFIRHLPHVTTQELQEMDKLNPKTPDELKEEQEEREFLNGADSHETSTHKHH